MGRGSTEGPRPAPPMLEPKLVTPPATTPITLDDALLFNRIVTPEETVRLAQGLGPAIAAVEARYARKLITQTWAVARDTFPPGLVLELPWAPLQSATVTYVDGTGTTQTLSASTYAVDTYAAPGRLVCLPANVWPTTQAGRLLAVTLQVVVGYGDGPASVPEGLRLAVAAVAGHYCEAGLSAPVPWDTVDTIAGHYRSSWGIA